MTNTVLLVVIWMLGLLGMPAATFLICKSIPKVSTQETALIRMIAGWSMILTGAWFIVGGYFVFGIAVMSTGVGPK